jgi:hypothetical protein
MLAALHLAAASACATSRDHVREHQGKQTLRLVNATASPICKVHVASGDEQLWGPSWIDQAVAPGAQVDLPVRPDDYILRVGACSGHTTVVAYHVPVDDDLAVVIHDGYPSARSDASTQMPELALPSWSMDDRARLVAPGSSRDGVELRVKNQCARDLRVVLGGDPSTRSGTPSTLPARASLRYFAPAGTDLWLVDPSYRVVARTELSTEMRHVAVSPTCDAFVEA